MKNLIGKSIVILITDLRTLEVETFEIKGEHFEYFFKQLKANHALDNKEIEIMMGHGIRFKISDSFTKFSFMHDDKKEIFSYKIEDDSQSGVLFQVGEGKKIRMMVAEE